MESAVDRATLLDLHIDQRCAANGFDPDCSQAVLEAAQAGVEHMLSVTLVASFHRVRAIIEGSKLWCESVGLNGSDFQSCWFQGVETALNDLLPAFDRAASQIRRRHNPFSGPMTPRQLEILNPEFIDVSAAEEITRLLLDEFPDLLPG